MYQELAKVLDSYSFNEKLLDIYGLEEIANIVTTKEKSLSPYLRDIIVRPKEKPKTLATYNFDEKIIVIYLEYIYKVLERIFENTEYRKKNEFIMQSFQHEIEHANQNLIANTLRNDLECAIVRASILIQENETYYLSHSSLCPLERMAEIDSLIDMMLTVRNSQINNDLEYFERIDGIMHRCYPKRFKSSPTERYIENAFIDAYFKFPKNALEKIKDLYTLEQRLRLGLRVTKNEFSQVLEPNLTLERLRK